MADGPTDDALVRFLFRDAGVRAEMVRLGPSWREVVARQDLPASVRDRLGELSAAALLLSASLKFDGKLIAQIHGDGPVSLLVVESDADGCFRSTCKLRDGPPIAPDSGLQQLVNANGQGRFALTLDPRTRGPDRRPYQGIVPFDGDSVAAVLEHYMARSEQVPTRLWLAADGERAAGLLLQRLPGEGGRLEGTDPGAWDRLQHLAETVTAAELLEVDPRTLLSRLFWQESMTVGDRRGCRFACTCSRQKVSAMLRMLGRDEVADILAEQGSVSVRCDYCNQPYAFDAVDCAQVFAAPADDASAPPSSTRH